MLFLGRQDWEVQNAHKKESILFDSVHIPIDNRPGMWKFGGCTARSGQPVGGNPKRAGQSPEIKAFNTRYQEKAGFGKRTKKPPTAEGQA